jgi:plasmid stabilization system protein ParE
MRRVKFSKTFLRQLNMLLAQGVPRFGPSLVAEKRDLVYRTINQFLAEHPGAKRPNRHLRLHVYLISKTPFVVLYDFDDDELRLHFVFHKSASLKSLDPKSAEW